MLESTLVKAATPDMETMSCAHREEAINKTIWLLERETRNRTHGAHPSTSLRLKGIMDLMLNHQSRIGFRSEARQHLGMFLYEIAGWEYTRG